MHMPLILVPLGGVGRIAFLESFLFLFLFLFFFLFLVCILDEIQEAEKSQIRWLSCGCSHSSFKVMPSSFLGRSANTAGTRDFLVWCAFVDQRVLGKVPRVSTRRGFGRILVPSNAGMDLSKVQIAGAGGSSGVIAKKGEKTKTIFKQS